jgi:predicted LPLAT superfamily acyltransferase
MFCATYSLFASISLDRVFLLTGSYPFQIDGHYGAGTLETARSRGALLFVAHFGSFEIMRISAAKLHDLPLRILLDVNIGRRFMEALAELNPAIAESIIDSSTRSVDLALKVREALDRGAVVGTHGGPATPRRSHGCGEFPRWRRALSGEPVAAGGGAQSTGDGGVRRLARG